MPFDVLKIDRSFITTCTHDERTQVLVATLLSMGHRLGFEIVAEGVETEEQRDFLVGQGCEFAQGYLFGRPMPAADFEQFCRAQGRGAAAARQPERAGAGQFGAHWN
jgi:EAL domain-containing protein (putative c-di-GMP-specific phosphodiesterase class I)